MKFVVGDKNRCCLVCVKFYLNRCRFAAVIAKCLGGSLFWGHSVYTAKLKYANKCTNMCAILQQIYCR